jgi:hypothetical protein
MCHAFPGCGTGVPLPNRRGRAVYPDAYAGRPAPFPTIQRTSAMKSNAHPRRLAPAALLLALVAAACNGAGGAETAPRSDAPGGASASQASASQAAVTREPVTKGPPVRMVVYKTPTCGCCRAWVEHAQAAGFVVEVHDTADVAPIKRENGLPQHLASCHTAIVDGYVIEGHVPADVIRKLLAERPQVAGIAVPGMPMGSPGMEVPGGRKDPYDIMAFARDGKVSVYETR